MSKKLILIAIIFTFILVGAGLCAVTKSVELKIFDPAFPNIDGWSGRWPDGTGTGAKIYLEEEARINNYRYAIVERKYPLQRTGVIFKKVLVDLDEFPILEIEVVSLTDKRKWSLSIEFPEVQDESRENLFVVIQPATRKIGAYKYNLQNLLDLTGVHYLEIYISAIDELYKEDNEIVYEYQKMSFTDLRFARPWYKFMTEDKYRYVFDGKEPDLTGWKDKWAGGAPSLAGVYLESREVEDWTVSDVVVMETLGKNFGCVYKDMVLDLNKYPFLEIEIDTLEGEGSWYMIYKSEALEKRPLTKRRKRPVDYVRIQKDTDKSGVSTYNLKKLTELSGTQEFQVQLGLVDRTFRKNDVAWRTPYEIQLRRMRFFNPSYAGYDVEMLDILGSPNPKKVGWNDFSNDATATGAKFELAKEGLVEVLGATPKNYASVYRELDIDLDKYPNLRVDVVSASAKWFLIMESPFLENGYIKIQGDTSTEGEMMYNIRELTGLSGTENFKLRLGISMPGGVVEGVKGKGIKLKGIWLVEDH